MEHIKENYREIMENAAEAAEKSGRTVGDVIFVAVSKTFPAEYVRYAASLGIRAFGENRVQELTEKAGNVDESVDWHLIGHLQTNKVAQIIDKAVLIQSLDSLRLAAEIDKQAKKRGISANCLVEINIADEATKFGVLPENARNFINELQRFDSVRAKGLMCVAPFVEKDEKNREFFRKMRELFVDIKARVYDNVDMTFLSMGMSGDYKVAIEEGSCMIRVGTGLFGLREKK